MSLAACALHHASTPFCRCGDSARMAAQANISMKQPLHTRTRNMEAARTVQRAAGAPCPNAARCAGRRGGARCGAQRGRAGAPGAGARPGRARRRRPAGPPGVPPGRAHGARAPHCRRRRGRAPAARLGGGCACGTRGGWEQWVACCRRGAESFGQLSQHIISDVVVGARRPLASACRLRPPLSRCGGLGSSLQLQHFPGWHKQAVQCMDVGKALPPQVRTDRNECYQPYLAGDTAVLLQRALMVRRPAAGLYRRERWEVPLAAALLELRECAVRLKLAKVGPGCPASRHQFFLHCGWQGCASDSAPVLACALASLPCSLHTPCTAACVRPRAPGTRRRTLRARWQAPPTPRERRARRSMWRTRWSCPPCRAAWTRRSGPQSRRLPSPR